MPKKPVIVFDRPEFADSSRPKENYPGFCIVELDKFDDLDQQIARKKMGLPDVATEYLLSLKRMSKELKIDTLVTCKFPGGRTCSVYTGALIVVEEARAKQINEQNATKKLVAGKA